MVFVAIKRKGNGANSCRSVFTPYDSIDLVGRRWGVVLSTPEMLAAVCLGVLIRCCRGSLLRSALVISHFMVYACLRDCPLLTRVAVVQEELI